jgi:hypothetical protein
MLKKRWIVSGVMIVGLIAGAGTPLVWATDKKPVEVVQAQTEIPEAELLDVGIQVFNPGLPEDQETLIELEEKEGVFSDLRKSEARYIPICLKRTLQSTGFWGAVRLVPRATSADVMVTGTILKSNGKNLELQIFAVDSLGKNWLKKKYKRQASIVAYATESAPQDPYQSLYNQIANDLLKSRKKRKDDYIQRVRTVSQLRFAKDLAPTAYGDYLKVDKKGRYSIDRLPAADDPMIARVERIRERDYMFIDTLNEYYADFFGRMDGPYDDWRAYSYEEQVALDKLRKQSRLQKILGAAAIVGGIYSSTKGRSGRAAGEVAILGGMAAIQDAMEKSEESKMHLQALQELGASLDSEMAPLLIDVEGEVMRLTGSVETQYATWRNLLRDIFATEMGLPVDPNADVGQVKQDPNKN